MTRREKIFALAKGFRGRAKNCFRVANQRVEKALQYQYRDRRTKKREFRREWIVRINAAAREYGVKYAEFIRGIGVDNVCVDRKILAELAVNEPASFKALVERVKLMRAAPEQLRKVVFKEEQI
jgi:large subunit ribosomal protein L20